MFITIILALLISVLLIIDNRKDEDKQLRLLQTQDYPHLLLKFLNFKNGIPAAENGRQTADTVEEVAKENSASCGNWYFTSKRKKFRTTE